MDTKAPPESRLVPPKEMFRGADKEVIPLHGIASRQLTTPVYHVELPSEGGVLSYHVGDKYPVKAWPFKEAVYAIDSIKRATINLLSFLASSPCRYLLIPLALFPISWKSKLVRRALAEYTDFTDTVFDRWGRIMPLQDEEGQAFGIQGVQWKPQYYCDMVREFRRVALQIAGNDIPSQRLVETISMVLEFDDAYRYRLQDGIGEMSKAALLTNPAEELKRVFKIMEERGAGTSEKFAKFGKVIPLLFKFKDFSRMLDHFVREADFSKMILDEVDLYRCLLWGGYQFAGIPDAERVSMRLMIDEEWQFQERKKNHQ